MGDWFSRDGWTAGLVRIGDEAGYEFSDFVGLLSGCRSSYGHFTRPGLLVGAAEKEHSFHCATVNPETSSSGRSSFEWSD